MFPTVGSFKWPSLPEMACPSTSITTTTNMLYSSTTTHCIETASTPVAGTARAVVQVLILMPSVRRMLTYGRKVRDSFPIIILFPMV
jgi:hypothetical protein